MAKANDRSFYMTSHQKDQMGKLPRTHQNCIEKTGVARPGKTRQDAARKGIRQEKEETWTSRNKQPRV